MNWAVQVPGVPWPKGSLTPVIRGKRAILIEDAGMNHREVAGWRRSVTDAGRLIARRIDGGPLDEPLTVEVTFTVPRPPNRAGDPWPHLKPSRTCPGGGDVDKMARLILDALTDAALWRDDSRVVDLHVIKCYPGGPTPDALSEPGAIIRVGLPWTPQGALL